MYEMVSKDRLRYCLSDAQIQYKFTVSAEVFINVKTTFDLKYRSFFYNIILFYIS